MLVWLSVIEGDVSEVPPGTPPTGEETTRNRIQAKQPSDTQAADLDLLLRNDLELIWFPSGKPTTACLVVHVRSHIYRTSVLLVSVDPLVSSLRHAADPTRSEGVLFGPAASRCCIDTSARVTCCCYTAHSFLVTLES